MESISDGILYPLDLFEAVVRSGYGASGRKIEKSIYEIQAKRGEKRRIKEEYKKRKQRYDSLIYKLKRDGLIAEVNEGDEKQYMLTVKGEQKLEILKNREGFPDTEYQKEKGSKVIIVMFDVPERWARKRTWIRMVLENLDFKMAQKSVWIGKTKIPKQLIADLMRMQMETYVEIFEVGNTGNIKNVL